MLHTLSARWAQMETVLAAIFAALVTLMVLINVLTRAVDHSIFWIDEAAIYAMIWMAYLGASATIHHRSGIAVTLLPDALSPVRKRWLTLSIDLVVVFFAGLMIWFCLRWYDPLGLIAAGFDAAAFQNETFNFIYAEPTNTLGIRKIWVWLIPGLFALGTALHAIANLHQSLTGGTIASETGVTGP